MAGETYTEVLDLVELTQLASGDDQICVYDDATDTFKRISRDNLFAQIQRKTVGCAFVTDNSVSQNKSIAMLGTSGTAYIDWGDGVVDEVTISGSTVTKTHTYAATSGFARGFIFGDIENITFLQIDTSQLTSIDLKGFIGLTSLDLNNNQLVSVDLSENVLIDTLVLSNNLMTALNVSMLPLLETLTLTNNTIASIDLSANTALVAVDIATNSITAINTDGLADLEILDVGSCPVATADIEDNILLTGANFGGCAITSQTIIDKILTDAAAAGLAIAVDISGGTNAAPSTGDGVPPISTILANGGTVSHN